MLVTEHHHIANTNSSEYLHLHTLSACLPTMAGLSFPRPQSLSSDECVGLPPFELFRGSVKEQLQQAISWRHQELANLKSYNRSSTLSTSPATASPVDISSPCRSLSSSIRPATSAPTVPQLPSAAQRTTPHHHQRHVQAEQQSAPSSINHSTPCQLPNVACITSTSAPRGVRAQPTACPLSAGNDRGCGGENKDWWFSNTQDRQKRLCTAFYPQKSGTHQHNTLHRMTESVKVKEDSTSYNGALKVSSIC